MLEFSQCFVYNNRTYIRKLRKEQEDGEKVNI